MCVDVFVYTIHTHTHTHQLQDVQYLHAILKYAVCMMSMCTGL